MKKSLPPLTVLTALLVLLLNACGTAATPASDEIISEIQTSAALTGAWQPTSVTPMVTIIPSSSPTPQSSPTKTPPVSTQSYPTTSACDNSIYVSDVTIPDGTIVAPSQALVKTWKFQNAGSCSWSTSYSLAFISGDEMGGSETGLDESIVSGSTVEVSVSLTAPDTDGTYTGYWRLTNAEETGFGASVFVQIVVSEDAATLTPTPTETSYTSTPTPTPASTETPIPSSTFTVEPSITSEPTSTPESAEPPSP